VQHGHPAGDAAHELHVVLDDDDGVLAGQPAQQLGRPLHLGVGHAGDRLVDQQHLRVLRQQHPDLQPLLLPVRQQAGLALRLTREADDLQHLVDPVAAPRRCAG
jgi:hypothetical protein